MLKEKRLGKTSDFGFPFRFQFFGSFVSWTLPENVLHSLRDPLVTHTGESSTGRSRSLRKLAQSDPARMRVSQLPSGALFFNIFWVRVPL